MTVADPPIYRSLAARLTDPATSHAAAPAKRTCAIVRARVYRLLERNGPMTHDEITTRYVDQHGRCTPQNIRTRVSELREQGGIRAVDRKGQSPTGKPATRWDIYREDRTDD